MTDLPLVLIGGWGVPVTTVIPLATYWPGPVITHSLDGRNLIPGTTPDDLVRSWLEISPARAVWAGWSLGGQLAMRAARMAPDQVAGVFTCCSTPCFLRREDWTQGMAIEEFQAFRTGIARQTNRFWKRFLMLQVLGDVDEIAGREAWKPWLAGGPPYSVETLLTGLDWLAELDQRRVWAQVEVPQQHIVGERDRLVDSRIAERVERMSQLATRPGPASVPAKADPIPVACRCHVEPGMAHWPFGEHAETLARRLAGFGETLTGFTGS